MKYCLYFFMFALIVLVVFVLNSKWAVSSLTLGYLSLSLSLS